MPQLQLLAYGYYCYTYQVLKGYNFMFLPIHKTITMLNYYN